MYLLSFRLLAITLHLSQWVCSSRWVQKDRKKWMSDLKVDRVRKWHFIHFESLLWRRSRYQEKNGIKINPLTRGERRKSDHLKCCGLFNCNFLEESLLLHSWDNKRNNKDGSRHEIFSSFSAYEKKNDYLERAQVKGLTAEKTMHDKNESFLWQLSGTPRTTVTLLLSSHHRSLCPCFSYYWSRVVTMCLRQVTNFSEWVRRRCTWRESWESAAGHPHCTR